MGVEKIYNFIELSERFGTSGYPEDHEFQYIQDNGYDVVINLVSNEPTDVLRKTEKKIVENLGLKYIHIPVVWKSPQSDDFKFFCEALENHKEKKIFIHCELNMRVSVFMMLYRVIHKGMNQEKAMLDVQKIWKPHDQWEEFIDSMIQTI
jgi:protein tyrosine phosphatase (PTP) superfamily phosphohydrolase (DUF442 family)